MKPLKIFVSSPMDVRPERAIARKVIERLALEFSYHFKIEAVMSEFEPMMATDTPQAHITPPSASDIVLVLLWARLGTPLPDDPRFKTGDDKRRPTGTEWEFLDALKSFRDKGTPDLLVYRKNEPIHAALDDEQQVLEQLHQKKELEQFLRNWFREADGSWKAWFHPFSREDELENLLETHLRKLIESRVEDDPRTDDALTAKVIQGNPYRGLNSFEIENAALFFGRARALNELREVLETQNARRCGFVIVTGASGSGKSSLVKAGLLSELKNPNRIGRVALCRHGIMRPTDQGGQLLLALASAILAPTALPELGRMGWTDSDLAKTAGDDPQRVIDSMRQAVGVAARGARLVDLSEIRLCLVIDQFEEIFTAGFDKAAIDRFTRMIALLARSELVWVVATLRSDFYHRLDDVPELLLLAAERGIYRLKPPMPTELGQMIRNPARLAGLRFQRHAETGEGLDAVLQNDAVSDPTSLALLEFTLDELWEQRSASGLLTFEAYQRIGGMTGAIAERAETVIAQLPAAAQNDLAPALRALITVSDTEAEPTAARVRRSQVTQTPERAQILDKLIEARLVTTDDSGSRGDPSCRLAHEALIQNWPRLKKLAAADRDFLEARTRLRADAEAWHHRARKNDFLLPPGSRLGEGEAYLGTRRDELDGLTIDFIERSKMAEREARSRSLRRTRGVAVALGALAILAGGLAVYAYREADRATQGFKYALEAADKVVGFVAGKLSSTAGVPSDAVESLLHNAEELFTNILQKTVATAEARERQAAMILSFAATSGRLGDFEEQHKRVFAARALLEPVCGDSAALVSECVRRLADSYQAEGSYQHNVGKPDLAIAALQKALSLRAEAGRDSGDTAQLLLARAETEGDLARAVGRQGQSEDKRTQSEKCLETSGRAASLGAKPDLVNLVKARCHFILAEVATDLKNPGEAARHADAGLLAVRSVLDRDTNHLQASQISAWLNWTVARLSYSKGEHDDAARYYDRAIDFFEKVLIADPQNYLVARDLSTLYSNKALVHHDQGRNDFAIKSLEKKAALARNRLATARETFWKERLFDTLDRLGSLYGAAKRPRDVLTVTKEAIGLHEADIKANPQAACRGCLMASLFDAGVAARTAGQGLEAFDYLSRAQDMAGRLIAEGTNVETDEHRHRYLMSSASSELSWIEIDSVPLSRRIEIFGKLAARAAQLAEKEPRVHDFRTDYGRVLHHLAIVYEQAGNVLEARNTHERASQVGSRDSTLILRRWYLEGFRNIATNTTKARELETIALRQNEPPTRTIQAQSRILDRRTSFTVNLFEPEDGKDALADEIYRLERFFGAIITEEDLRDIRAIYATAKDKRTTVAAVAGEAGHGRAGSLQDRLETPLQNDLDAIDKLVADKNLAEAATRLAALAERLKAAPARRSEDVLSWGALAEAFHRLAVAAEAAKETALHDKASEAQLAVIEVAIGLEADESSSLRLSLAQDWERLAARAKSQGRARFARIFYERAIHWREKVRYSDPKNAECACSAGSDYDQVAKLSKHLGSPADALSAYHRALIIFEDLAAREPRDTRWKRWLADLARDLSKTYAEQSAPSFAFTYADRALQIRKEFADTQSASTQERIDYAEALEALATRAIALARGGNDEKVAKEYVEKALSSRLEANRVRVSVLEVDPANGTCRCNVGSNLAEIGSYYRVLGQNDKWIAALTEHADVFRRMVREESEGDDWKKNLAEALAVLADALLLENDVLRAKGVLQEELDVLQKLQALYDGLLGDANVDQKQVAEWRFENLVSLSFTAVLVGRDSVALAAAEEALKINPDDLGAAMNRAHPLMYLGRVREARAIYLGNKGQKLDDARTWDEEVLNDFKKLIGMGRPHRLIDEVTRELQPNRQATR